MREHSRITFRSMLRVKIYERTGDVLIGHVGDLSGGGLRLVGDELLEVGQTLALRLRLRDADGQLQQIDIDVVCQWSRENPKSGRIETGFALQGRSPEYSRLVVMMMVKRGTSD